MLVDAQVHVISPDRDRYPLHSPPSGRPVWVDRYGLSVEQLLVEMGNHGVDRAVLVQAYSAYRFDNRYTAESARLSPDHFVCSCIVDIEQDPAQAARYWALEHSARGIRLFLEAADVSWLDSPAGDAVLDEISSLGVIAQVLVRAEQLASVLRAASRHPSVSVLVDHCGFPDLSGGDRYPNARDLFSLAEVGNVYIKLSSQVFRLAESAGASLSQLTESLVSAFGADRVMWASDLTVQERPYGKLIDEAEQACAGLNDTDRALFMGGTAAQLWWP